MQEDIAMEFFIEYYSSRAFLIRVKAFEIIEAMEGWE